MQADDCWLTTHALAQRIPMTGFRERTRTLPLLNHDRFAILLETLD